MPYPAGLRVHQHLPVGSGKVGGGPAGVPADVPADVPVVVLVHGTLDRAASFARTVRRLDDLAVITYDRRGYGGSRGDGPAATLAGHVDDLLGIVAAVGAGGRPVTAVGHSVGGDVVIGAALSAPTELASVGVFEPPMPWLGFHPRHAPGEVGPGGRAAEAQVAGGQPAGGEAAATQPAGWPPDDLDPAEEAERFFCSMVGQAAWDRLPERDREARRSEGPAVVADLAGIRGPASFDVPAPFDVTALTVPAVFGRGGEASRPHHRDTVGWLANHVAGAELFDIPAAGHGAHLTHPDAFADFVRRAASRAVVSR